MNKTNLISITLAVLAVVLIVLQFTLTSDTRYDDETESYMRRLSERINTHHESTNTFPEDFQQMDLDEGFIEKLQEREITYKKLPAETSNTIKFEICAQFKTDTTDVGDRYLGQYEVHEKGHDCVEEQLFTRTPAYF